MNKKAQLSLTLLRVALGLLFLIAGVDKLLSDFTAAGYLNNALSGPFVDMFASLAGQGWVDFLVIWGEIAIGISFIFGIFFRPAAIAMAVLMGLIYISALPAEHGPISELIIYMLVAKFMWVVRAGRIYGLDRKIEEMSFFKKNKMLSRYLLG